MSEQKGTTFRSPAKEIRTEVVVIGAGPGGYTAAFRAADLGKKVVLIDSQLTLGGVCLNVGCIPSKTLLHTAKVINEASELLGVRFGTPEVNLPVLRDWKNGVVNRLTSGLAGLAKQRGVTVVQGQANFTSGHTLSVTKANGTDEINFEYAIIAAGSSATRLPSLPYDDPRLMDSTGALELKQVPERLLVIGGGIIGLEMATVYQALGSKVSVVELAGQLVPGADPDVVKPLAERLGKRCETILLNTRVIRIEPLTEGLRAFFDGPDAPTAQTYDCVLVAVGRRPNGHTISAETAGVQVDERGFIAVNEQMQTNVPHIYAVGDIVGGPMLAHKATHEGRVAAEVIAGHNSTFEPSAIPSVAYTDPEIAWVGLTEQDAIRTGVEFDKGLFPWAASGRALSMGRSEGFTKLLFEKGSRRIIGAGIVGVGAGELIGEMVLALELGAQVDDVCVAVHPHPSLSETIGLASEIVQGSITDIYLGKK